MNKTQNLLAQRDVRISLATCCIALLAAIVMLFLSGGGSTPLQWYVCGLTSGFAVAAWAALVVNVRNAQERRKYEEQKDSIANDCFDRMIRELRRRGDDYEAVMTIDGPAIRRKPRDRLSLH
jgi:hypothetical protein